MTDYEDLAFEPELTQSELFDWLKSKKVPYDEKLNHFIIQYEDKHLFKNINVEFDDVLETVYLSEPFSGEYFYYGTPAKCKQILGAILEN